MEIILLNFELPPFFNLFISKCRQLFAKFNKYILPLPLPFERAEGFGSGVMNGKDVQIFL